MAERIAKILLFFLPFHAFLVTMIGVDALAFWKELAVLAIFFFGLLALDKKDFKFLLNNKFIWLVIAYMAYTTLSLLWAPDISFARISYGLRYDLAFLGVLLAGMTLKKVNLEELLKWTFFGGTLALIFGLFLHLVVGPENFTMFGYRNAWSNFGIGEGLAFCQKIENQDLCRFQGTFSGPNQAAFYILMYLPLAAYFFKKYRALSWIGIPVALVALVLTFSRSAWIGLMLISVLYLAIVNKKWLRQNAHQLGILAFAGIVFMLILYAATPDTLIRPESTLEHFTKWIDGIKAFSQSPIWGLGVGEAGPATRALGSPFITESWFLQVAVHGGIIGFGMFVWIYLWLMWELYSHNSKRSMVLFLALVAMLTPLNLLHAFEDSSTTYSLFLLIGAYLMYNETTKSNNKS
jgi:O-antigen ligase